jgi:plasmid replication initiation protein
MKNNTHREFVSLSKWPFLALSPRSRPIDFVGKEGPGPFRLQVTPIVADQGLATIADGDVLVFAAARYIQRKDQFEDIGESLSFSPPELLDFIGRAIGGRQRALLRQSLSRLRNTQVRLFTHDDAYPEPFRLLEAFDAPSNGRKWSMQLPDFFAHETVKQRILSLPQSSLSLRGLRRRLYAWGLAHSKPKGEFAISLHQAYSKAASEDRFAKFHATIRRFCQEQPIPGFHVALEGPLGKEVLKLTVAHLRSSAQEVPSLTISSYEVDPSTAEPVTLDLRPLVLGDD